MRSLLSSFVAATLGLWLAVLFIPGVSIVLHNNSSFFGFGLTALWQVYLMLGIILGLLNFFVKPILNVITLPLRILTLGLFSFVVSGAMIWVVDAMFREFSAPFLFPLLWTTLIIWILNLLLAKSVLKENE